MSEEKAKKAFGKKKQLGTIKFLDLSNKKNELKQIPGMFPQHPMNNLIYDKLKRLLILQDIIKIDNLS